MVCIDSDILIDFIRDKDSAIEKIRLLRGKDERLCVSSISSFELLKGAYRSGRIDEVERMIRFLSNFCILDFDMDSSGKSAEIFEKLKSGGVALDVLDVMIAATCITNEEVLLTGNKKHFERIEGLELV